MNHSLYHINWGTDDRSTIPLIITTKGDLLILIGNIFYLIDTNVKTIFDAYTHDISIPIDYKLNEDVITSIPKWTYLYSKYF